MTDTELSLALHEAARSMGAAKTAAAQGDWAKAEQALLAAEELNNTLLREIGLKLRIEARDEAAVGKREATGALGGIEKVVPTTHARAEQPHLARRD